MARLKRIGHRNLKNCIFCGGQANSDEDVWPRWILERFRAPTFGLMGTVGDDIYLNPTQKRVRLRCVCVACNNNWMSQLEEEVIPPLSSMGHDVAIPLSRELQGLISVWAVKTAMVWEYFGPPGRRRYYFEWDRASVRASRAIPDGTTAWLAHSCLSGRFSRPQ